MITNLIRNSLFTISTSLILFGCGENYRGNYIGDATLTSTAGGILCNALASEGNQFSMEAAINISDNKIEVRVRRLQPKSPRNGGGSVDLQRSFSRRAFVAGLRSEQDFDEQITFDDTGNEIGIISGRVLDTREEVQDLELTLEADYSDPNTGITNRCTVTVFSPSMVLLK